MWRAWSAQVNTLFVSSFVVDNSFFSSFMGRYSFMFVRIGETSSVSAPSDFPIDCVISNTRSSCLPPTPNTYTDVQGVISLPCPPLPTLGLCVQFHNARRTGIDSHQAVSQQIVLCGLYNNISAVLCRKEWQTTERIFFLENRSRVTSSKVSKVSLSRESRTGNVALVTTF